MRLVLISDTHLQHEFAIPDGDMLIHAGDLTFRGDVHEVSRAAHWLEEVRTGHKFKHVVVAGGNHDWMAERDPAMMRMLIEEEAGCIYLDHQPKEIAGLRFFGSGYTPAFCGWALNVPRGPELAAKWAQIPDDTQILVTHGPRKGYLDSVYEPDDSRYSTHYDSNPRYKVIGVGCADLAKRITELKALRLHVFGHVHSGYGIHTDPDGLISANSSICNERYDPANAPHVVDLDPVTLKAKVVPKGELK